jgi:hypothetical protein
MQAAPATAPAEPTSDELAARGKQIDLLIEAAGKAADAGDQLTRRTKLNAALTLIGESARSAEVRASLAAMNTSTFLGSDVLPNDTLAPLVPVEAGDSFLKLARRYQIPLDLMTIVNPTVSPTGLRPGVGVKVILGPFHVRVVKHAQRLDLLARNMYVRSYTVNFDEGNFLPAGVYRVGTSGGESHKGGGKVRLAPDPHTGQTVVSGPGGPGSGSADLPPGVREWIGFSGAEPGTRTVVAGWLCGSAGPRGAGGGEVAGVRLQDADLHQLYNVLVEGRSLIRVEP